MKRTIRILGVTAVTAVLAACGEDGDGGSKSAVDAGAGGAPGGGGAAASSGGARPGGAPGTGGLGGASTGGKASSGGTSAGGGAGAGGGDGTGGAGGSGNPVDGGPDAAPEAGAVTCAPANLCDDFEAYEPGGGFGDWEQNGSSGTVSVDGTRAFSGEQSVHFRIDPGGNKRVQLERTGAPLFPVAGNAFWGRVMVYASDLPGRSDTEDKDVHYDVIQASGAQPGEYRIAGMGHVLLNYEPHDCYFGTDKIIPEDRWACWEWLFDGERNVIEFYIDGALQARIEGTGQGCVDGTDSTWEAPTFDELRLGFVNYQSKAETTDLWMDDFAAGPARIGCPAVP